MRFYHVSISQLACVQFCNVILIYSIHLCITAIWKKKYLLQSGVMLIITKHHQHGLYLQNHQDFRYFSYKATNTEVICRPSRDNANLHFANILHRYLSRGMQGCKNPAFHFRVQRTSKSLFLLPVPYLTHKSIFLSLSLYALWTTFISLYPVRLYTPSKVNPELV